MQFAINNMTSVYIEEIYHIKFLSILIAPIPIYFHPAVLKIPCQFDDPKRNYFRKIQICFFREFRVNDGKCLKGMVHPFYTNTIRYYGRAG